jgi:phosphatidylinositol kinase/protein kinase (PI-3  family)
MLLKLDDDLTQDQLTLQLIAVMDSMWRSAQLDMRLTLYSVLPTGNREGYIEAVPAAVTIAQTQRLFGGPLSSKTVIEWLKSKHPGRKLPADVIDNYYRSLAGYCVATYVLGIGDRHCSNMMIREDGRFFHIDFGHFLGHFKKAFGIDRETRTFYYSEALEEVLTVHGKRAEFHKLCEIALKVLRKKANTLIYLLLAMIGTGIPELQSQKDVKYLENVLMLHLSDEQACKQFKQMFKAAKVSLRQKASDVGHIFAH